MVLLEKINMPVGSLVCQDFGGRRFVYEIAGAPATDDYGDTAILAVSYTDNRLYEVYPDLVTRV